ncbi:hypothetical protein CDIK_1201 [Cucumispora dikerogammari]|nr:hypothetical protein CDIK_1201 [Cucumispora dikerogammari]
MSIKHLPVRIKAHRSNGKIERVIRTIKELLGKSNQRELEEKLTNVVHRYNNTYHRSIKYTPKEAFEKFSEKVKKLNSEQDKYQKRKQKRQIKKFNKNELVRIAKNENLKTKSKTHKGKFLTIGSIVERCKNDSYFVKDNSRRINKKRHFNLKKLWNETNRFRGRCRRL